MSDFDGLPSIEQALARQGSLLCPVKGDSMMPLLDQTTDLVRLVPVTHKLNKHDLPLYRRPSGALVLHRIIRVKKKHYVICGDNRTNYEYVPHEWVIALAVGRVRGDDYLSFDDAEYRLTVQKHCAARDCFANRMRAFGVKLFPPKRQMEKRYPILVRRPILLLPCYVARWFGVIWRALFRRAD